MYLISPNRQALESLTDGLKSLEKYLKHSNATDLADAKENIEKSLEIDRDCILAIHNYAEVLCQMGNYNEAAKQFERLINECDDPALIVDSQVNLDNCEYLAFADLEDK